MDEETAMECGGNGGGGGARNSDGRQAARAMGVDVDELEVRVASETSDRLAEQADGPVRIKKKRGKRGGRNGSTKAAEAKREGQGGGSGRVG